MKKVLIHGTTTSSKLNQNPREYPFFNELILKLKNNFKDDIKISQLITEKDKRFDNVDNYYCDEKLINIKNIVNEHDVWISHDSFFPHYCNCYGLKSGIVIFTISDPNIFGYKSNINLIKDKRLLRENQFMFYRDEDYNKNSFIEYDILFNIIKENIYEQNKHPGGC